MKRRQKKKEPISKPCHMTRCRARVGSASIFSAGRASLYCAARRRLAFATVSYFCVSWPFRRSLSRPDFTESCGPVCRSVGVVGSTKMAFTPCQPERRAKHRTDVTSYTRRAQPVALKCRPTNARHGIAPNRRRARRGKIVEPTRAAALAETRRET